MKAALSFLLIFTLALPVQANEIVRQAVQYGVQLAAKKVEGENIADPGKRAQRMAELASGYAARRVQTLTKSWYDYSKISQAVYDTTMAVAKKYEKQTVDFKEAERFAYWLANARFVSDNIKAKPNMSAAEKKALIMRSALGYYTQLTTESEGGFFCPLPGHQSRSSPDASA